MTICQKHTNVKTPGGLCPICLIEEIEDLKRRKLRQQLEHQNADPIWKAVAELYDEYYRHGPQNNRATIECALGRLMDAWNTMLE